MRILDLQAKALPPKCTVYPQVFFKYEFEFDRPETELLQLTFFLRMSSFFECINISFINNEIYDFSL